MVAKEVLSPIPPRKPQNAHRLTELWTTVWGRLPHAMTATQGGFWGLKISGQGVSFWVLQSSTSRRERPTVSPLTYEGLQHPEPGLAARTRGGEARHCKQPWSCLGGRQGWGHTALVCPTMIYWQELIKEECHLIKKLVIKKESTQEVKQILQEQQMADEHSPENCGQGRDEKCDI